MCAIVAAGFHLDRVLSNGLFPVDMAATIKDADVVLMLMLSSLVDAPCFSKERDGFLHTLLDKHPLTIISFITQNQHIAVSRNKDGKSAFEVYSGKVFFTRLVLKSKYILSPKLKLITIERGILFVFLTKQRTCFTTQPVCARIHRTKVNFVFYIILLN